MEGKREVTGRRGRRSKRLLDYLKEKTGYWKLKEEALRRLPWRPCFGRGYGLVRQTTAGKKNEWMDESDDPYTNTW